MITVLTGENSFEIDRDLQKTVASFEGRAEKIDGNSLELKQLPDLLMGGTLFAEKRLVIIKNPSENKTLWSDFSNWLPRLSSDVQLVIVESKLDKRTKTYKDLQKAADIHEFKQWTERDSRDAVKWVEHESNELGLSLDTNSARSLVARVGVDQWALYHALQKLAVLESVTPKIIEEVIDANPVENVFNLFEAALKKDAIKVKRMLEILEISEDPYRLFGLLSGQVFQLAAMAVAEAPNAEIAKDLGAHPFVLQKLAPFAKKLGKSGARKIVDAFVEADAGMKTSVAEPWLLIERALIKVACL
jgi:DNA polymerase-3 subunit delta